MGSSRRLLVGPHGPSLRDRLIAEFPHSAKGLWIVPSELAREQVERDLAWVARSTSTATVWTWKDLSHEVRARQGHGPILLSDAATRTIRNEAIKQARVRGQLSTLSQVLDLPGYRKRIRDRIAGWTQSGRDPEAEPPHPGPIAKAEWRIFQFYRNLLDLHGLEDEEGLANWAAKSLWRDPPKDFQRIKRLRVVEPPNSRASLSALEVLSSRAEDSVVTLRLDKDPSRSPLFEPALELRERFLEWGFDEEEIAERPMRLEGLDRLARDLFRDPPLPRSDVVKGIRFLASPEGEGEALVVARRVLDLIETGVASEDVVLVSAREGLLARRVEETLLDWGIEVRSKRANRQTNKASLSALQLAANLPAKGWSAESLGRLLRHGRLNPFAPEPADPLALARAATVIRESRAYRGDTAILEAIRRLASSVADEADPDARSRLRRIERATTALPLVERVVHIINRFAKPGTWSACVENLEGLARTLGLNEATSFDTLRVAIEDHQSILERLKLDQEIWSWTLFTAEVSALIRELGPGESVKSERGVSIVSVGECAAVSSAHLILFGLAEGVFPDRSPGESDAMSPSENGSTREMGRFLKLVDGPRESVTLAYPVTDAKGERLIPSRFVEEVRGLFTTAALKVATSDLPRLGGILRKDLAIAPNEARVRAVGRACTEGEFGDLRRLARDPQHSAPLAGAARALLLAHWRGRRERFDRFDGRLRDPRIIEKLTREFSSDRRPFSASQLENLSECPFRYYLRYVLGLEPIEDRQEFQEDHAANGSLLHSALELLHARICSLPDLAGRSVAERIEVDIEAVFEQALSGERQPYSEIERGQFAIDAERMRRTARRYARQFRKYAGKDGQAAECQQVEIRFGNPGGTYPALTLGSGDSVLRVQGIIDRIDVLDQDGRSFFRVIDYKSGSIPVAKDIDVGLALQLPLYAMAAERVLFADNVKMPLDAAYWGLKKDGFAKRQTMSKFDSPPGDVESQWRNFSRELERYVLDLVDRSRAGEFPVLPQKSDCDSYCDFRFVCRVRGTRRTAKSWGEQPTIGDRS